MSKIPCEIIQDLLPSYIDELTSDVTNREVEAHMTECEQCRNVFEQMKAPDIETTETEEKEIDFLKKTKKKHRRNLILSAAVVWAIAILFFGARYYLDGQYMNTDYLSYNLDVSGSELSVVVNSTSDQGIQKVEINEAEGVVEISVHCVPKSIFYQTTAEESYTASETIRQVWIGDRIIWANGEMISPLTSGLYAVYNPYIGNMPSNGKIVNVLNMTAYTGGFTNELQTSEEPYSWKMIFQNDFSADRQAALEERLKRYAYIYLAEVGNLGEVIYDYHVDGEPKTLSVTSSEASEYAGVDIKSVGTDINRLEQLIRKTGLSNVVLGGASVESNAQADFSNREQTEKVLEFTVINYAEDAVYGMGLKVDCGKVSGHQSMCEANGAALQSGLNVNFQLIPEDFASEIEDGATATIRLSVVDQDGKEHEVQGAVYVDLFWGNKYRLNLSGNARDGYFLGQ
ncbi:MAG: DUF4825 domain-containing protein [Lachnospiraceae bacterium]|nr:DUF4825 domain-containing protein [Lachnospiraceae bacterium]